MVRSVSIPTLSNGQAQKTLWSPTADGIFSDITICRSPGWGYRESFSFSQLCLGRLLSIPTKTAICESAFNAADR
ncbi:hypothetical protein E4U30_001809 [Claviceps sp. LM220 group G6]|nr:hypothetical protein E4U30_001809 [Claviceps sp. LM220 group G6]